MTFTPPLRTCDPAGVAEVEVVLEVGVLVEVVDVVVDLILTDAAAFAGLAFAAGWVLGTPGTCALTEAELKTKPDMAIAIGKVRFINLLRGL